MQFGARAARAGVAHHPKVVLLVAIDDVDGGIESGRSEEPRPVVVRLLVEIGGFVRARLIDGRVKALGRKFPAPNDQLPGPFDRLLLEVIAEAPVAQHLEKRVVIGVEPDVVEVVMLASGADAFLGVGGARRIEGRPLLAEENRHELVHARIGEKEIRRVRQER